MWSSQITTGKFSYLSKFPCFETGQGKGKGKGKGKDKGKGKG